MMNNITISILGMYQYNNEILDQLIVPTGVDREVLVNEILLECANMPLLYMDADIMKMAIENWNKKELPIWTKLYESTQFDYNPIWNVDEDTTETRTIEREISNSNSNTSSASFNNTTTNAVKAFNENNWTDHEKETGQSTSTSSDSGTGATDENMTETLRRQRGGNIGVTMTQQLIEAERKVVQFDIYDHIVRSFKNKFTLLIY